MAYVLEVYFTSTQANKKKFLLAELCPEFIKQNDGWTWPTEDLNITDW